MCDRRSKFQAYRIREAVKLNHILHVPDRNSYTESDVFYSHIMKSDQRPQTVIKAVFYSTKFVIGSRKAFDGNANPYLVPIALSQSNNLLSKIAISADYQ